MTAPRRRAPWLPLPLRERKLSWKRQEGRVGSQGTKAPVGKVVARSRRQSAAARKARRSQR